jgi:hypothetical protein
MAGSVAAKTLEIPLPAPGAFSTTIDNPYWPLPMSSSSAYRAETEDGCEYNKVTVTTNTKIVTVGGTAYTTLIIRDQEWEDEDCDFVDVALVEDTHDYHAQEIASKRVWYFGEESWSADDEGDCTTEGSWEAGLPVGDPEVDPAEPGIIMLGDPTPGDRYQQEYLEDEAEDWGAVLRLNGKVSTDLDDYYDCLITKEWTPLEPGEVEHKFYCLSSDAGGANSNKGLVFIEELKGRTVYVEYIGSDFGANSPLPGENDATFPSTALDCEP